MIRTINSVLVFVAISFTGAITANANGIKDTKLPVLKVSQVLNISEQYIAKRKIKVTSHKIVSVQFHNKLKEWYVTYDTDSLVMGDGSFSIIIEDVLDNPKITFSPSY